MTAPLSDNQLARLIERLDILVGNRGTGDYRAVRWNDLIAHPEVSRIALQQAATEVIVGEITEPATGTLATLAASIADAEGAIDAVELAVAQAVSDAQEQVDAIREEYGPALEFRYSGEIDLTEQVSSIYETLMRLQLDLAATNGRLADAGLYIDEDTGQVRLYAQSLAEERFSSLSLDLDAARAEIALRATTAEVNGLISDALLDPTQIPIIDDLELRLGEAELTLNGYEADLEAKASLTVVNGHTVTINQHGLDISALEEAILLTASSADLDDVEERVSDAELELSTYDGARFALNLSDVRNLKTELDELQSFTLEQLLNFYNDRETLRSDIAYVSEELTAKVNDNREAVASAVLALGVRIDGNVALIESETTTRANESEAFAGQIDNIQASVTDLDTRQTTAEGAILDLNTVDITSNSALVTAFLSLEGAVNDENTGLAAAQASIADLNNVDVSSDSALVTAFLALDATVNDESTGLAAAQASIEQLNSVDVGSTSALVIAHLGLSGLITDQDTGLAAAHGAISDIITLDLDPASALLTKLDTLEANISLADDANFGHNVIAVDKDVFSAFGSATTGSNAGGALGQTGTVNVTSTAAAPSTAATTNGAILEIPAFRAANFVGRRIRIDVLAAYTGGGTEPDWGVAISTNSVGNSGAMASDVVLTSTHQWGTFYYDVPANAPGALYLGIYPSLSGTSGKTINVARAAVRLATLADEVPGIGVNSGLIQDILNLEVDENSALALHYTNVSSTLFPEGGTPLAVRVASTEQAVDGVLGVAGVEINNNGHISGYALVSELIDGDPSSAFGVVADKFFVASPDGSEEAAPFVVYTAPTVVNGATVPAGVYLNSATVHEAFITTAMIQNAAITRAQIGDAAIGSAQIGDAAIGSAQIADVIESTNFAAGLSGWQIKRSGDAEFNSIVIREENIADGAVTESVGDEDFETWNSGQAATKTVVTVDILTEDRVVIVSAELTFDAYAFGAGIASIKWWLEKDGTPITEDQSANISANTPQTFRQTAIMIGAGTYRLRVEQQSGSGGRADAIIAAQSSKK